MPVVALVGAGLSVSAGIAAGVGTLIGGLQIAGGVLAAVGTITKNKKLTALGALVGVGAGIASAANNAGTAASEAAGAGEAATSGLGEGLDPGMGVENAGAASYAVPQSTLPDTSGLGEMVDATGGAETANADFSLNLAKTTPDQLKGIVQEASAPRNVLEKTADRGIVSDATEMPKVTETSIDGTTKKYDDYELRRNQTRAQDLSVTDKSKSRMTEVMDFLKDPKNKGIIQVGGGIVDRAMKGISDQKLLKQKAELEEELKQRERDRMNDSIRGMARFA